MQKYVLFLSKANICAIYCTYNYAFVMKYAEISDGFIGLLLNEMCKKKHRTYEY